MAVKFLRPGEGDGEESMERFLVEAEALSRIRHENIVEIFETGRSGSLAYMVLEYLDGGSLAGLYDREAPLPWRGGAGSCRERSVVPSFTPTRGSSAIGT